MERYVAEPVFVANIPVLRRENNIMQICRDGKCRYVMPMEVFEAYMFAGMEQVTEWRGRDRTAAAVLPFKRR